MPALTARFRVPFRTITRGAIAHGYSNIRPVYVVNEFPKSGGTWISNVLSTLLRLPFHDNKTPPFEPQVLKGHFYFPGLIRNGVIVWRDGRDVMTSFYHHSFFKFADIPINHAFVDMMRDKYQFADYNDVKANLPAYLEGELAKPSYPSFTWAQFVDKWHGNGRLPEVKYEDMRRDPIVTLADLAKRMTGRTFSGAEIQAALAQHDIKKIVKQQKPVEGQRFFVRSGKAAGWKEDYSEEALDIFNRHAGYALKKLGYV